MGSVKDRLAIAMIEDAERRGVLKPGPDRHRAHVRQHRHRARDGLRGEGLSVRRGHVRQLLRRAPQADARLGAKVVLTPAAERGTGMVKNAAELAKKHGWFLPQQFENPANPAYHRNTTGPEILRDFAGQAARLLRQRRRHRRHDHRRGRDAQAGAARAQDRRPEPDGAPLLSGGRVGAAQDPGLDAGLHPGRAQPQDLRRDRPRHRRRGARRRARARAQGRHLLRRLLGRDVRRRAQGRRRRRRRARCSSRCCPTPASATSRRSSSRASTRERTRFRPEARHGGGRDRARHGRRINLPPAPELVAIFRRRFADDPRDAFRDWYVLQEHLRDEWERQESSALATTPATASDLWDYAENAGFFFERGRGEVSGQLRGVLRLARPGRMPRALARSLRRSFESRWPSALTRRMGENLA